MSSKVLETMQIVPMGDPKDATSAGITGDYVSLKDFRRCLCVVNFADGTATSGDITCTLYQAQDVAGTAVTAMATLETGRIYVKQATAGLTATGQFSEVTQATALSTYTSATSGESSGLWCFEIKADDLDATQSMDCIRMDVASATGSTKIVAGLYILSEPRYPAGPTQQLSAIVD